MKMKYLLSVATDVVIKNVYDSGGAGWKLTDDGKIESKDGNPVFVDGNGNERTVQTTTISRLNAENQQYRTRAEKLEADLKLFEGIDPVAARDAIKKLGEVDLTKLVDAGKVDEVRAEVAKQYEVKLGESQAALNAALKRIDSMTIDNAFQSSTFISEKIAIPADIFRDSFGKYFQVKEGKIVATGADGNVLYSPSNYGEPASFDEALKMIVEAHPRKDQLILAQPRNGTGNDGGGGREGSGRIIKRSDFDTKSPSERAEIAKAAGEGKVKIID